MEHRNFVTVLTIPATNLRQVDATETFKSCFSVSQINHFNSRFEVLAAVLMKTTTSRGFDRQTVTDVSKERFIFTFKVSYQPLLFSWTYLSLMVKVLRSFEKSVTLPVSTEKHLRRLLSVHLF
jgi:hypothetical protein